MSRLPRSLAVLGATAALGACVLASATAAGGAEIVGDVDETLALGVEPVAGGLAGGGARFRARVSTTRPGVALTISAEDGTSRLAARRAGGEQWQPLADPPGLAVASWSEPISGAWTTVAVRRDGSSSGAGAVVVTLGPDAP